VADASGPQGIRYTVGCDIGGTFTDLVLHGSDGSVRTHKVPSTPDDYGRGIVRGIDELARSAGVALAAIDGVVHATTVATNTILEMKGAQHGAGHHRRVPRRARDAPAAHSRALRPAVRQAAAPRAAPPAVRGDRADGRPRRCSRSARRGQGRRRRRAHRRRRGRCGCDLLPALLCQSRARTPAVAGILRARLGPDVYVTCSADILPEIREYERTSTTVVNAYIGPVVARYLGALGSRIAEHRGQRAAARDAVQRRRDDGLGRVGEARRASSNPGRPRASSPARASPGASAGPT
jgi:N-methylhydantoinase A